MAEGMGREDPACKGRMHPAQEDLNNIVADKTAQADAITNDFLDQLVQDSRGR